MAVVCSDAVVRQYVDYIGKEEPQGRVKTPLSSGIYSAQGTGRPVRYTRNPFKFNGFAKLVSLCFICTSGTMLCYAGSDLEYFFRSQISFSWLAVKIKRIRLVKI